MTVQDIYLFLDDRYPFLAACDFDNSGLLIGDKNAEVTKAVITLDCTRDVVDFAVGLGAELIITHHPVIFGGIKSVTSDTAVYSAIKNGVSVISAHTNLDTADGGINDTLCNVLGLKSVEKIICEDGFTFRKGVLPRDMTADELAVYAAEMLCSNARYVDGGKKIRTVAVCSGSGSDMLYTAISSGADAYLSSEIKHNVFLSAMDCGLTCLDLGHFATERIIIPQLTDVLSVQFPTTQFTAYTNETIKHN